MKDAAAIRDPSRPGSQVSGGSASVSRQVRPATWERMVARSRRLFSPGVRQGTISLVDQAISSGLSFLTTVLIGRFCGPGELGTYALGFSLVLMAYIVLNAVVAVPYAVYGNRLHGTPRAEFAGAVLVHNGLLSAAAALALLGGIVVISSGLGPPSLVPVLSVLVVTIPFILLREFARRFCFAHLRAGTALVLDLSVAVLQTGGLLLLVATGRLSAVTANILIGLVSAAAGLVWLTLVRRDFVVRWGQIVPVVRQSWTFGGWVFASGFVSEAASNMLILWLLALIVDERAAGVFAATATIVRLCNPLVIGVGQLLTPWVARAYHDAGVRGAQRVVRKASLFLALEMGLFCVVLFFAGGLIMEVLYGSKYAGYEYLTIIMALSTTAAAVGMGPGAGLWTLERPDVTFKAHVLGFIAMCAVALSLPWSVLGAVCSLLAGQVTTCTTQWISFSHLARRKREEENARVEWESVIVPESANTVNVGS